MLGAEKRYLSLDAVWVKDKYGEAFVKNRL